MLRRMGMRSTQNAMATELEYIRALKVRRTHIGGNRWSLSMKNESDRRRGRRRRPRPFVTASSRSCFLRLAPIRTCFMHALKIGFIFTITRYIAFPRHRRRISMACRAASASSSLFACPWCTLLNLIPSGSLTKTIQELGVKTDRNGFLTEDGLVAFYRDFGQLADDIEAAGVCFRKMLDCSLWALCS